MTTRGFSISRVARILCVAIAFRDGFAADASVGFDAKASPEYRRIKAAIDQVRSIDTHDHLRAFHEIAERVETPDGRGMTLYSLWKGSYYTWIHPLTPWPADGDFAAWWESAQHDFADARATGFYRYLLVAFRDLYGVDFETITSEQASDLNRRVFENYRDARWLTEVVTKRANIELMFIDPYWNRMHLTPDYDFTVPVLNVTTLMSASHPDHVAAPLDSPYTFAERQGMPTKTFADFLRVVERIFENAVASDVAALKSTQAYDRTLRYERVSPEVAERHYGKPPAQLTAAEQKEFEDFMFWHVCGLSAKHGLPFQIHTGQARVQGSNPLLLVDAIEANPDTKFILFHGGFPWVGEAGVIAMRHPNVWIDSVWLPTLSYTMAKRAFQEWLEMMPSNRIMWGADTVNAEGIYAATEMTRQCLAEALAEKVLRHELREDDAVTIGRQIMRENALEVFPKLRRRLRDDG